jgi:hypothetical protein
MDGTWDARRALENGRPLDQVREMFPNARLDDEPSVEEVLS